MSANLPAQGAIRQLDKRSAPVDAVPEADVEDAVRLAKLLTEMRAAMAEQSSHWAPRRLDFEDRVVEGTGAVKYRFEHRFGARVRYWPVEWSGAAAPNLRKDATSTNDVLVLTSTSAGTVTLRVEESG